MDTSIKYSDTKDSENMAKEGTEKLIEPEDQKGSLLRGCVS